MSNAPLGPCPACLRHVRADAPRCPFCAAVIDAAHLRLTPDLSGGRLTRAAIFAFATSVAACSSTQTPARDNVAQAPPAPADAPAVTPAEDAGAAAAVDVSPASDPALDASSVASDVAAADVAVADSGARADAGRPRRGGVVRSVSVNVRYGAPPPPEAWA